MHFDKCKLISYISEQFFKRINGDGGIDILDIITGEKLSDDKLYKATKNHIKTQERIAEHGKQV